MFGGIVLQNPAVVFRGVAEQKQTKLFLIVPAGSFAGGIPRIVQSRQQHSRQNRNDRYHDQEFYQCKLQ